MQKNVNKCKTQEDEQVSEKRIELMPNIVLNETLVNEPSGIIWDGENYSCAYDALFTVLWNIWLAGPTKWSMDL